MQNDKTTIIIQARMGSTRLPGKILLPIRGRPMLSYLLERVRNVKSKHSILIATTNLSNDDVIETFCREENVSIFRGSEEDVLSRYYQACCSFPTHLIVRITSDCPLIDPQLIDQAIDLMYKSPTLDYVSNTQLRTFPRGMDVEIFTFEALKIAFQEAQSAYDREHVTPYLYKHPEFFNLANFVHIPDVSHYRLTVDTHEDFTLISKIFEHLYPVKKHFTLLDVLQVLKDHPEWEKINAHVQQKKGS